MICLAGFVLVTTTVIAVWRSVSSYDIYQERLAQLETNENPTSIENSEKRLFLKPLINSITRVFASQSLARTLQFKLFRAGIPLKGEEYVALWIGSIFLAPLAMYLPTRNIWALPIGLFLGLCLPHIYLKSRMDKRLQLLNQQLGDALVIMANALRAGIGFQQAMDAVKRELPDPISAEFAWTLREMNLGMSHEEAMLNLGRRVGSDDLDMIITGIIIQRQVGGNLAEILDNISSTIRERTKIKRQIKVLTAQGRLSGLIIGLLPVVLIAVMLLINPTYFNILIYDIRGITILVAAVIMEIMGFLMINKIVDIDI
ncbi:type II secretion system F family protein [Syntrophomonas palmitatica]|uniref:type II secretion system F family protein n=1 Tax=Syntrophomonas palmitatica TaxID=402877 RepID=UPI001FA7B569|nr:type II secretion system F family protein [Syntrophomonas palmitatica]